MPQGVNASCGIITAGYMERISREKKGIKTRQKRDLFTFIPCEIRDLWYTKRKKDSA